MSLKDIIIKENKFEDETREFFSMVRASAMVLVVYFILTASTMFCVSHLGTGLLCCGMALLSVFVIFISMYVRKRILFHIYSVFMFVWVAFATYYFGAVIDAELMLLPILVAGFLATYENFKGKVCHSFITMVAYVAIYFYNFFNVPETELNDFARINIKLFTIVAAFVTMFIVCWFFANTTQEAQTKLAKRNLQLSREAQTDPLTDLPNRRNMYKTLDNHTSEAERKSSCFCVAMGDIDFFKKINDTRGHNCGDYVLVTLANMFKDFMMDKGTVCRWGGEEFFFFFPDGNGDQIFLYMEHLRLSIEKYDFEFDGEHFNCTMTFGVAEYNQKDSSDQLVQSVDRKLYAGKEKGRNRVIW